MANASATKVLPVPIGPVNSIPIGTRLVRPSRMFSAITQQVLLDLLHAADHIEAVLRLDELDQAEALALEDLALAPHDQAVGLAACAIGRRRARIRRRRARAPAAAAARRGRGRL